MAKLGLGLIFILNVGLVYFPNPTAAKQLVPMHRFSCMGVEHDYKAFPPPSGQEDDVGGNRRTIGSGPFYKSNPEMWSFYDVDRSGQGQWLDRTAYTDPITGTDPLQVELYWIKADGRILNGWFHVVVKHVGPLDRHFGILQMHGIADDPSSKSSGFDGDVLGVGRTDYKKLVWLGRGGFGEFVHDFPSCTDDQHKGDLKHTKYQFMPCGGIPGLEQTMPWGFQYVEPKDGTDSNYLVPADRETGERKHKEFHMNFRFTSQPCNHPGIIRIAAIAYFPDGSSSRGPDDRYRYGLTDELVMTGHTVVGAADPVPRPGTYNTLDCSSKITSPSEHKYVDYALTSIDSGHGPWRPWRAFPAACTEATTRNHFDSSNPGETNLFGGRCDSVAVNQGPDSWNPERAATTRINQCIDYDKIEAEDPSTGEIAVEYYTHIANITYNIASLCAPCPTVPPRPVTTERTSSTTTSRPTGAPKDDFTMEELAELKWGVELIGSMALEIWDTRLLHGICMTILSIFVSPINIFITRYFKETFMDTRIMFLRLWYFVHHSAMMASAILYGAGLWRVVSRRILAGVSLSVSATVHRSLGWVSIAIVILLALLGGFRPIERKLRTYVIAAHWTAGMTIYFMNYALMINSVSIPASPSALVESSDDSFQIGKLVVPVLVIVWILFDVVMHVLMTIHVCNMDKRLGLTRPRYWLPVPISVLPEDETRDLIGSWHRKKMLVVYGVVSLVVTVAICCLLGTSDPKGRGLGLMSCTHYGHGEYWQEMGKKRC